MTAVVTDMFRFTEGEVTPRGESFHAMLQEGAKAARDYVVEQAEWAKHMLAEKAKHQLEKLRVKHNHEDRLSGKARSYFDSLLPQPFVRFLGRIKQLLTAGSDPSAGPS